ncbi:hypothetical protein Salat_0499800 [Sesamum alatum]|uniref:Uncharacterized protein n=1 Tax=Sesamum alatum TaxID=300844 RepID=A0AAE2D1D8_9LAMI|nr:hypothetical protein Salat_0499800 [Sesamum alatum]
MAASRPGPVTSARAAPRKLEGRTSASSWADPGSPARGRLELGWTTVDHPSLELGSSPAQGASSWGGPPSSRQVPLAGLYPRLEALPRAPARSSRHLAGSTRGSRHYLEHQPANHPCTASSTSPRTRGSRQVPRAGVVRRLCLGLEAVPRAPAREPPSSRQCLELGSSPATASSWAAHQLKVTRAGADHGGPPRLEVPRAGLCSG